MSLPFDSRNVAAATSSPEVIETGFPVTGRVDHAVAATVTNLECPQQMAPADASDAEKNRKFLENVVAWPVRNDAGTHTRTAEVRPRTVQTYRR